MPVYEGHRDNILGVLDARDLLGIDLGSLGEARQPLKGVLRKPFFVPESKAASDLFDTFQERSKSFALVVDEYGGVTGVVTMGDLLECIFGDIPNPSDEADEDTNTTMATALMIDLFGDNGSWLAVVLAAPLIWVFGEIVPKSIFQQRADVITPYVIFALRFFSLLFYPILLVFSFITRALAKLAGGAEKNPFTLREEILTTLQMPAATDGDIELVEKEMIRRMFSFSERRVQDAMRPLIEVTAIARTSTCGEARRLAEETSHVRLPVYAERVDRVVGMLHVLDLLGEEDDRPVSEFIRQATYVPTNKSVRDLLFQLRKAGEVVAVVVDEFGGAEGIVTVEDIVEEVVEDLQDEYDVKEPDEGLFQKLGDRDYLTSGRTELDQLAENLNIDLPGGGYSTVAGFILHATGSIPAQGTQIKEGEIALTVHKGTAQAIQEVRIRWTD